MLGKLGVARTGLPVAVLVLAHLFGSIHFSRLPLLHLTMNAELISSLGNALLLKKLIPLSSSFNGLAASKGLWEKALHGFTLFAQKKLVQVLYQNKWVL